MIFRFPNSHVFEGTRVDVKDDGNSDTTCQIHFGDGVSVLGICHRTAHGGVLEVPGYTTAGRHHGPPREWSVKQDAQGQWKARTS